MKVKPMIKITDIQKQVIDGIRSDLKPIFKDASDIVFGNPMKNTVTDSDFECFKDELEGRGVFVTWDAIARFFGVQF